MGRRQKSGHSLIWVLLIHKLPDMMVAWAPCAGPPVYTYVGCYADGSGGPYEYAHGQRTLPVLASGDGGLSMDECAAAARDRGYPVFALQWRGDCFMGSVADVAKMNAASQKLADSACLLIPCDQSAASCPGYINKVFLIEGMLQSA
jgi:hypothetical protein